MGDGFPVKSLFSYHSFGHTISPFLLLDYAGPASFPPADQPRGVDTHPHRGFETVTIVYQGEVEHRDSAGNAGSIGPGDVQWMTAASGIVHEEKHSRQFTKTGGMLEMIQLWINLPKKFKNVLPGYQSILKSQIPPVPLDDGAGIVRVIAGEFQSVKGPATTYTPINVWEIQLKARRFMNFSMLPTTTTLLIVLRGAITLNTKETVREVELAHLDRQGEQISIKALEDSMILLLNGEPIDEPVVGYGPFVMNTEAEIRQAIQDYQNGKMGNIRE